jgi:hypoxanthine phosphoribosyltransferase
MTKRQPPSVTKVLYGPEQIAERVRALGREITTDYRGRNLVVLSLLKGSFVFAADLIRAIDLPLRVEFLGLASYGAGTESTGVVQITQDLTSSIVDEDVLIVEDIVDSGLTLSYLLRQLETRKPRSVKVCSLLHKPAGTKQEVPIHYLGFTIPDEFVVGYGLDYGQAYRNLPFLGILDLE